MKRNGRRLSSLLLVFAVLGALAFGAKQALASSRNDCTYEPPTLLGACAGDVQCQNMCEAVWHDPVVGDCIAGCCVCFAG